MKKITQADLGRIVGLHDSNIGRIENGKVLPSSDVLLKIATYFEVSCEWLLTGNDTKTSICENADEFNLLQLYRQLLPEDKNDVKEMIEYKLYKNQKKKHNLKSSTSDTKNDLVG